MLSGAAQSHYKDGENEAEGFGGVTRPHGQRKTWENLGRVAPFQIRSRGAATRNERMGLTHWGLLLLFLGSFVLWVSARTLFALLPVLGGAILLLLGRTSLGREHSRNVQWSLALYLSGLIGLFILIPLSVSLPVYELQIPVATRLSVISQFLLVGAVLVGFSGLSWVLFTLGLHRPLERSLLWATYGAFLGLLVWTYFVRVQFYADCVLGNPLCDATLFPLFALFGLPFAILFAPFYLLAYLRLGKGEIPA